MGTSDGNVVNLRQHVNHWLARQMFDDKWCLGLGSFFNLAVPMWLTPACKWASDHPTDRDVMWDNVINYTLIERRGDVAVWEVIDMSVSYLTNNLLFGPAACVGQDLQTLDGWTGAVINVSSTGVDPLCLFLLKDTVNWQRMFFMTMHLPYEGPRMRDDVRDYVIALVALADSSGITETADIWKVLMNEHMPEEQAFRNEFPYNWDHTFEDDRSPQVDQYYEGGASR